MASEHDRGRALELLRCALGNPDAEFRSGQWEAIDAVVNKRKMLLVVERTGWGKSSVYFIATRILRDKGYGPTLIISPLLALMRNQIEAAERLGIRALTINSTNRDHWPPLLEAVLNNEADAVLISPERLANDAFYETVLQPISGKIGLLVVDEAHCISDWGHDFRPDYRRLVNVLRLMPPNMAVLGTTATANNRVIEDISTQLGNIAIQRGPLLRETLALQTIRLPDQSARLAWLAEHVPELPGTGIIYTLTKRDAEQVSGWLNLNGIKSRAYYSDVKSDEFANSNSYRLHLEAALLKNEIKTLVATTALGMGYDKPDLGFVIHYQAPGSIITYYQQVGRAGRAINYAIGVLLSGKEDDDIHEYFRTSAFPEEHHVNRILGALSESDGLSVPRLESEVNISRGQIEKVLKYLSVENPSPVLKDRYVWRRTPIPYLLDHERIERLTRQRHNEWQEVQDYIDSQQCHMMFLANSLDDGHAKACGKCCRCLGRPVISENFSQELAISASMYLKQADLPLVCKKQVAAGAFQKYNFRGNLPADLRAETGRILSRWGDAGWGAIIAEDKHNDHFRDELVDAVFHMIRDRWRPFPAPEWVTCVPSRNHTKLVPDFARRLAKKLGLPFVQAVTKVIDNEQQKLQQNRYRQCRNLDGAFAIGSEIPDGPVLLVDDIVDSAWTMTIVAALLRLEESGPVFPVALASTSTGN